MHGHDAHHVVGLLGDRGLDLDLLLLHRSAQVADERAQSAAARGGEEAGVLDDRQQVGRRLLAAGCRQGELDQTGSRDHASNQLGQRQPASQVVQVGELLERLFDDRAARAGSVAVGERAGACAVDDELLVADREGARLQGAHQRQAVCRIVDRCEHPDQVAHLLALEEVARSLMSVGDAGVRERFLVVLDPRPRRDQDRDVAPAAVPPAVLIPAVPDLPALVVGGSDQGCEHSRLLATHLVGVAGEAALGDDDRRTKCVLGGGRRIELHVAGLHLLLGFEDLVEGGVERVEQRGVRSEARRYLLAARPERAVHESLVQPDVGAPEAVDGLLRVAHNGQPSLLRPQLQPVAANPVVAAEQQGELGLHGVRVLELVDQQGTEALAEVASRRRAVSNQVACPEEQVVVVGYALALALLFVIGDEAFDVG